MLYFFVFIIRFIQFDGFGCNSSCRTGLSGSGACCVYLVSVFVKGVHQSVYLVRQLLYLYQSAVIAAIDDDFGIGVNQHLIRLFAHNDGILIRTLNGYHQHLRTVSRDNHDTLISSRDTLQPRIIIRHIVIHNGAHPFLFVYVGSRAQYGNGSRRRKFRKSFPYVTVICHLLYNLPKIVFYQVSYLIVKFLTLSYKLPPRYCYIAVLAGCGSTLVVGGSIGRSILYLYATSLRYVQSIAIQVFSRRHQCFVLFVSVFRRKPFSRLPFVQPVINKAPLLEVLPKMLFSYRSRLYRQRAVYKHLYLCRILLYHLCKLFRCHCCHRCLYL
nr:MAG TPA: hypothetical protein [Caudoviricetes sp.]